MPPEERLPCRGCTRDCPDYDRCDGKPWRLQDTLDQSWRWADLSVVGSSDRKAGESLAVQVQSSAGASGGTMIVENW